MASISSELHLALSIPTSIGSRALSTLARRFHGETLSDDLGLEHSPTANVALNKAIHTIGSRWSKLRRDPATWDAASAKHLAEAREQLAEITDPPECAHSAPATAEAVSA